MQNLLLHAFVVFPKKYYTGRPAGCQFLSEKCADLSIFIFRHWRKNLNFCAVV